jgi:hypothetical protein
MASALDIDENAGAAASGILPPAHRSVHSTSPVDVFSIASSLRSKRIPPANLAVWFSQLNKAEKTRSSPIPQGEENIESSSLYWLTETAVTVDRDQAANLFDKLASAIKDYGDMSESDPTNAVVTLRTFISSIKALRAVITLKTEDALRNHDKCNFQRVLGGLYPEQEDLTNFLQSRQENSFLRIEKVSTVEGAHILSYPERTEACIKELITLSNVKYAYSTNMHHTCTTYSFQVSLHHDGELASCSDLTQCLQPGQFLLTRINAGIALLPIDNGLAGKLTASMDDAFTRLTCAGHSICCSSPGSRHP